ncbi:LSU ribosomal protein L13P [Chitinophaga jiangningensis]|uniref:Large ribosomal subunit protein uL13 n=1 Tax=Chitinophaga jiangningensis TaxID=1419482 RepID=A0A1M7HZL7_9BACT|nr:MULTISPECIES: 50S ribosomal protein L13 [Chitinophaga]MBV7528823.1 50S ribosomal protein L13 [Chitinophaga sp. sic0106]SHM33848.1 LSU ribosomal protein L13P [Chitinophaga jiangningensis]
MNTLSFRTKSANDAYVKRDWHIVDATNLTLGRVAAKMAAILRGKNKPYYTPHTDCGDYIIVINAEKIVLTGNKMEEKEYIHYTGFPGGQRVELAKNLIRRRPEVMIEKAVKGMLPKNRLGRKMYKKLFVYAGAEHPHAAQKPQPLTF